MSDRLLRAYRHVEQRVHDLEAENERLRNVAEHARHLLAGGGEEAAYHLARALDAIEHDGGTS